MENTLIIFTGDNGAALLRGKGTLYQTGLRVPFIVRWDREIKSGFVSDALLSGEALAPTVLEIAGLQHGRKMSGNSFTGLLTGGRYAQNAFVIEQRGAHDDM